MRRLFKVQFWGIGALLSLMLMYPMGAWPDTLQGFDKDYYLSAKLSALQASDSSWQGKTTAELEAALAQYGFTAETHYMAYGYQEGLEPNQWFNRNEYMYYKAQDLVNKGSYSTVEEAQQAFQNAWTYDYYYHYLWYGAAEGINPSSNFDETQYLTDKLAQLQAQGNDWDGKTIDDLRSTLASMGMTVVDHYMNYGQGEGMVPKSVGQGNSNGGNTNTGNGGSSTAN